MELTFVKFLIVCPLVFLAGFVDAIGGGGGLISLPAYLMAGLPPINAVATNKLSSTIGTAMSTARYVKNGHFNIKLAIPSVLAALAGAQIGARIALSVDDKVFKIILLVLLPLIAVYIFVKKDLEPDTSKTPSEKIRILICLGVSLVIGTYDGFYGPGTGTFLILAYTALAKMDVLTANGNTKLANLASNLSALIVFLIHGESLILLGLVAGAFSIAGNFLGAGFAMKKGAKGVKYVILVVIAILFVKVITEAAGCAIG